MYLPHFGLQQPPFSIAPDPRYLYMSERHREALAHLLYGVQAGGGFVLLTGEIGAGKTTVCRCFLEQVPAGCQVAYIVNPKLSVAELLQTVAEEFGISLPAGVAAAQASTKAWVDALNQHLLAAHAQGRHCLLIIDEAQHLSAEVLEQLRLLTNLETHERKLLQIILIGQPELRSQLAAPGMEQLAQRVIARYHLQALSAAETSAYVAHRLVVAGLAGAKPFDSRALRRVHALTAGVPRRINLLCDRALLGAYAQGLARADRRTVDRAALEVFGPAQGAPAGVRRGPAVAALAAVLVLVAGLLLIAGISGTGGLGSQPNPALASAMPAASTAASTASSTAASERMTAAASASAAATAPASASAMLSPAGRPAASQLVALPAFDAAADWPALATDEAPALRALAQAWGVQLAAGAPCGQAAAQGLVCWRQRAGNLPLLSQLDRPVVLALVRDDGRRAYAQLLALGSSGAALAAGGRRWSVSSAQLAALWRGELVTFWRQTDRLAPGLAPGASGPAVAALHQALAQAAGTPDAVVPARPVYDSALRQRVAEFQLAAGLNPDGLTGPTTFMLLNRALAVDEPRLARE